uniref:Pentatricopeptide repeat-containing protein At3g22690 family n=1 Tax=Cajanus cajan TaxID=3821 RepID=A0A151SD39_CAJCA|nr:Pentatricopeptide repeat-containing protein At3g22690 family [Cajanus cajan]
MGLEIHGLAFKLGFHSDPFIQSSLISMYAACGRIVDARLVFDKMSHRDVVTWNIMIDGYSQSGLYDHVLKLYEEMKTSGTEPDAIVLCTVLSACGHAGNLSYGKAIHEFIKDNGLYVDYHLQTALVNMYANCGAMDLAREVYDQLPGKHLIVSTAMLSGYAKLGMVQDARFVFDQMVEKDLVCWSAMISGYAESDEPDEAIRLFNEMQRQGIVPDQITMLSVISACAHVGALVQAKWIHMYVDKNGFGRALSVNNALIDMYAKCGNLARAREVFENMPRKNVISWSSMINAFAMHGDADSAIDLFHRMKEQNIEPNGVTFIGVLYACSHAGLVEEGQNFFSSMINEHGISPQREHYGCMVDLYCRANLLRKALELVETMPFPPNVIIWGSLMSACQNHGLGDQAILLYVKMVVMGIVPDKYTFPFLLSACSKIMALSEGMQVHGAVVKMGLEGDIFVSNSLIHFYAECAKVDLGRKVFDRMLERNVVSWTSLINGYAGRDLAKEAVSLFFQMVEDGVEPNPVTMVCVISACAKLKDLELGKKVCTYIRELGVELNTLMVNALVDMYMKCGDICAARRIFDECADKNLVMFNTIMSNYVHHGWPSDVLVILNEMLRKGPRPDKVTMLSTIAACAQLGDLSVGESSHGYVLRNGLEGWDNISNAIIDMYMKCGKREAACKVFELMSNKTVVTWNSLIAVMAMEGNTKGAIELFNEMLKQKVKPDDVVFVALLTACSHGGSVDEGRKLFGSMEKAHGISPQIVHYGCMVDLLGRAGLLKEALNLIQGMPMQPNDVVWGSLLAACRKHKNVELAHYAAEKLTQLAPERVGIHVLLSNIYASAGKWNDVARVRLQMKEKGVQKVPGSSLIEVHGLIHEFISGDESHAENTQIGLMLQEINCRLNEAGYIPDTTNVLLDVDEQEKEHLLSRHSEKLAMAYGLITTGQGMPIRVVKNLRMCSDCHSFAKLVSKLYNREITVRDNNRYHFFNEGFCSCKDYW